MGREWIQGKYNIINEDKYIGARDFRSGKISRSLPEYRSSFERRVFSNCDLNDNIIKWGNELIVVPYVNPLDKKSHKYYTDIYVEVIDKNTKDVVKYVFEIKPKSQTICPKPPKRKTKKSWRNYQKSLMMFEKNNAKWKAARAYCKARGMIFKLMTEKDIFKK